MDVLQKICPERSQGLEEIPCVKEKCAKWVDLRLGDGPTYYTFRGCGMIHDRSDLLVTEEGDNPCAGG